MDCSKDKLISITKNAIIESIALKNVLITENKLEVLVTMAQIISNAIMQGGKLLLCGNGGSAADAQHLATELLVRLRPKVNRSALPAINLALDTCMLTAIGNDYIFEEVFVRPLAGLGQSGDVLLGITTSGESRNVLKALALARTMNLKVLGLLGGTGGSALELCDTALVVPSDVTARIQEVHIMAGHIIMELVEEQLIMAKFIVPADNLQIRSAPEKIT